MVDASDANANAGGLVCVTGAAGFIGRALCGRLAREGYRVRAVVRRDAGGWPAGIEAVELGEIGADTDWGAVLAGVRCVVHLAGRAHRMNEGGEAAQACHRANAEATAALARAAARAGVRRLVFASSVKVNGESSDPGRPFREQDAPNPADDYARSKWQAEQALGRVAAETGLEIVVLRLPLVYGPGVKANFLALLRAVDRGLPLPLGRVDNRRSLLYLDNLVDAILLCLAHPAAAGRTFLLSDGDDVSTPRLIRVMARALGRRPRLLPLPVAWLKRLGRWTGRAAAVERLTGSLAVDGAAIREQLGWRPACSAEEGLRRTCEWYAAQRRPAGGAR